MPRIHLGVYMTSGKETTNAVTAALRCGYRAIDSAEWYGNEAEVGRAISAFIASEENTDGLTRGEIWFTTKLRENRGYEATRQAIRRSIRESGLGYVDLFLLHSPYGGRERRRECWRAVEDAVGEGEVRAAGVSNFGVRHVSLLQSDLLFELIARAGGNLW
jgi:diketogulonate reductase-like aldo/keto reductase